MQFARSWGLGFRLWVLGFWLWAALGSQFQIPNLVTMLLGSSIVAGGVGRVRWILNVANLD